MNELSRFPDLYAFLTGGSRPPAQKTPPLPRRGSSPANGHNTNEGTQDMVAVLAERHNKAAPPPTIIPVDVRPLSMSVRTGRLSISPELARRILDEAHYDRQRGVYKSSLRDAELLVTGGEWIEGYQIWFAKVGNDLHLIDGQHRLSALWSMGVSRVFQVEVLECETLDEAHALYARMDRFGRKRTDSEMLNALNFSEGLGVGKLMAKAAFKAAPYLYDNFRSGRYGRQGPLARDTEKVEFLRPWSRLIKRYDELISSAETDLHRALMNPGIVALALLTLRDQPLRAAEFWQGVAANDGLRRGDPRHSFVAALRNRAFHRNGLDGVKMAAAAWNAFYEDRKISFIRTNGAGDLRIAGVRRPK